MEAVGAVTAGSVTAVKHFAAQSHNVLLKLRSLIAGVKDKDEPDSPPPSSVQAFFEAMLGLKDVLDKLPDLLVRFHAATRSSCGSSQSSSPGSAPGSHNAVAGTADSSEGPRQAPNGRSHGDLHSSLRLLESRLANCLENIRPFVHVLRAQVADEKGRFEQSWTKIGASHDGTFEKFARTLSTQAQALQNAIRKLGRQLDQKAQGKLEAITEKVGTGGVASGEASVGSSGSSTDVAVEEEEDEDASSTRSEAAESATATKAAYTPGNLGLGSADRRPGLNGASNGHQQRGPSHHYACEAVSGIDGAAEEQEDGSIACMYCGRSFAHDDETTIHRLGFHLVRTHGFGLCNLNCTFETRSELLDHLVSFHAWSRGGGERGDQVDPALLDRYFLTRERTTPRSSRLLDLEDGNTHNSRAMREDGEETGLLNLLVLNEILRVANLDVKMDAPRPAAATSDCGETTLAHELCLALSQLDRLGNYARAKSAATATANMTNGTSAGAMLSKNQERVSSGAAGAAQLKLEVDFDDLVYHAACVQQELAVSSGGEDVLRHEALYSADQYRIDDLVCMYFPPRASPDRHRAWYVRPVDIGPAAPGPTLGAVRDAIKELGITRLEPAGPLRTFRDAIRLLGRAHMDNAGVKSYMPAMPALLRASKVLLRQDRRPPDAASHTAGWNRGGLRQVRMPPMRSNTMPLLQQPLQMQSQQHLWQQQQQQQHRLDAANLARLVELQQEEAHLLAQTMRERRLRWITDEGLDWWFLGMLERSASFRRLLRSGKAFPDPTPARGSSTTSSKSKSTDATVAATQASRTRLAPYAWAAALLGSAGLPQGGGGVRNGRPNMDRAVAIGSASRAGSNGQLSRPPSNARGPASPALSLAKADRGSGSEKSAVANQQHHHHHHQQQQQQQHIEQSMRHHQQQQRQQQRQQLSQQQPHQQRVHPSPQQFQETGQDVVNGNGKGKEVLVDQGPQGALSNQTNGETNGQDDDDEDEEDKDEDEDQTSSEGDTWDSSSSE